MKNKKVVYFLVGLLLLIWGRVFLRIIEAVEDLPKENYEPTRKHQSVKQTNSKRILSLNYRDPFLEDVASVEKIEVVQERPTVIETAESIFPDFKFKGTFKIKNNTYILVKNADEKHITSSRKMIGKFRVRSVTKDSLVLIHKGKFYTLFVE